MRSKEHYSNKTHTLLIKSSAYSPSTDNPLYGLTPIFTRKSWSPPLIFQKSQRPINKGELHTMKNFSLLAECKQSYDVKYWHITWEFTDCFFFVKTTCCLFICAWIKLHHRRKRKRRKRVSNLQKMLTLHKLT